MEHSGLTEVIQRMIHGPLCNNLLAQRPPPDKTMLFMTRCVKPGSYPTTSSGLRRSCTLPPPPPFAIPPPQGGNVTLTFLLETVGCTVFSCSFSASALCQS